MVHFEHSLPTLSQRIFNTCCSRNVGRQCCEGFKERKTINPDHRYAAVCQPYSYNTRETSMRPSTRLVQILTPVLLLSILVNIPRSKSNLSICKYCERRFVYGLFIDIFRHRFFEVVTSTEMRNVTLGGNLTRERECVTYEITDLRMDPTYIRWPIENLHQESNR